jgi:hypothetical protein
VLYSTAYPDGAEMDCRIRRSTKAMPVPITPNAQRELCRYPVVLEKAPFRAHGQEDTGDEGAYSSRWERDVHHSHGQI